MALKARHMKELQDFQNQMHEEIKERAQALGFDLSETEPIYDGVCALEGYSKSKPKIMFILKEAWDEIGEGGPKGGGWEIYEPWESMDRMNDTWKILMYIVYGVRTGEDYNSMPWANEEMLDMLKTVAYVNLNKMPAYKNSGDMSGKYAQWRDILLKQIEGYNPNVIVFGNTFEGLFEQEEWAQNAEWIEKASNPGVTAVYKTKNGKILIDAYHPKQRKRGLTRDKYIDTIVYGVRTGLASSQND